MKTVLSATLALALLPLSACAPKVNDPADVQAITQTMNNYVKAVIAGDVPGSVAAMTDKTGYYEAHMPATVGKDAIAKFHKMLFDQFTIDMNAPVADVRVEGGRAVVRGTYTQKLTPKSEGLAAVSDSGNWSAVLTRQAGGAWTVDWIMGNSDQPMPGSTADGAEEQAVIQIEREWVAALLKSDKVALEKILAKEWAANADGEIFTRAETLKAIASGAEKIESAQIRDLSVHIFSNVAVATMIVHVKGTAMGQPLPPLQHSTDFFVKREGRWQAIGTQNTTIK